MEKDGDEKLMKILDKQRYHQKQLLVEQLSGLASPGSPAYRAPQANSSPKTPAAATRLPLKKTSPAETAAAVAAHLHPPHSQSPKPHLKPKSGKLAVSYFFSWKIWYS